MEEDPAPVSAYKIERCPYDIDSDKEECADTASPDVPALLKQLRLLNLFRT